MFIHVVNCFVCSFLKHSRCCISFLVFAVCVWARTTVSGRKRDCICCFIWGSVPPSLVLSPALSSDRCMTSCVNRCKKNNNNTVSSCSVDDCLLHCTASQGYGRGFIFCICHYDLCVVCNVKQTNKQANKQTTKKKVYHLWLKRSSVLSSPKRVWTVLSCQDYCRRVWVQKHGAL